MLIMKDDREKKSFGLERSTNDWKETDIFALISISKHLKLDKKLIRFDVLIIRRLQKCACHLVEISYLSGFIR